jgi:hypothetical protein
MADLHWDRLPRCFAAREFVEFGLAAVRAFSCSRRTARITGLFFPEVSILDILMNVYRNWKQVVATEDETHNDPPDIEGKYRSS